MKSSEWEKLFPKKEEVKEVVKKVDTKEKATK